MADLAEVSDVVAAWRPLTTDETTRATYLLGRASRKVRRRWPDVDDRIDSGDLDADDVVDVVVELVLTVLAGPPVPGAKSWSVTSGQESRSVTLAELAQAMTFTGEMVEVFEGALTGARPRAEFPCARAWPDGAA